MAELIIRGGTIVDPASNRHEVADLAFSGGKVAPLVPESAAETIDAAGLLVVPGLIDLHAHVYWGGTSLGVDAAEIARASGTTTFVDAGSAGPGNFHGFRRHVIEPSPVRILPILNLSYPGIFAFSASVMVGEAADLRLLDLRECVRVARENRDLIVGIKVRVGRHASGDAGVAPLDMALDVAEETGLRVMAHLDFPPPSRLEVMSRLRPGDILTHCFRPFPNAPVTASGQVRDEVIEARRRGVVFDIGHGGGSFGFRTAEAMLESGFPPDVISSDVHAISVKGPAYDLLVTMSKFLALGMSVDAVLRASTIAPAEAIGRPALGALGPDGPGDATLLEIEKGAFEFRDVLGETRRAERRFALRGIVLAGRLWHDAGLRRVAPAAGVSGGSAAPRDSAAAE